MRDIKKWVINQIDIRDTLKFIYVLSIKYIRERNCCKSNGN